MILAHAKNNYFFAEDDFPKFNIFEYQKKLFFENFGFNKPFKSNFYNENLENNFNLSIRE